MSAAASISATLERLQYLLLEEAIPSDKLRAEVKDHILPELRQLQCTIMAWVVCENLFKEKSERDLDFERTTRRLLYSIEDRVESVAFELGGGSRPKGSIKSIFGRSFGKVLANLTITVNDLKDAVARYVEGQDPDPDSNSVPDPELGVGGLSNAQNTYDRLVSRAYSVGLEDETVGLEDAESELVQVLADCDNSDCRVVSICGMGGIGKTTLAKKLYNHPRVRSCFEGFAWVYVGISGWKIRDILVNILGQLSSPRPRKGKELIDAEDVELAEQLHRLLQEKNCLLVLDDCWASELWDSLRIAFPFAKNASKLILTTRMMQIAYHVHGNRGRIWQMSFLTPENSWNLFSRTLDMAIVKGSSDIGTGIPPELKVIGREIIYACVGLPLAIILLAGMLSTQGISVWRNVLDYLRKSTRNLDRGPEYILSSYLSLPLHLRMCFLYLGSFPNNSRIQVDKLCQLWIAEGLISSEDKGSEETMMDVAARYFCELVVRSLVTLQEDEVSDARLKSCYIHDLIRDLCMKKGVEEELFEVMESSLGSRQRSSSARRCAVYLNRYDDGVVDILPQANLHSLLFVNSEHSSEATTWPQNPLFDFKHFRLLRVLEFGRVGFQDGKLPEGVGKLTYLTYLSFRECWLKDLPSDIGNLIHLQTLDLRVKKECKMTISNVIWKLKRLKHLYLPLAFQTSDGHSMLKLDGLEELEILQGIDTNICSAKDLIKLTNLRNLAATAEGNLEDLEQIFHCMNMNSSHLNRTVLDIKKFDCYTNERLSFIQRLFSCRILDTLRMEGLIGKMPEIGTISPMFTEIVLNGTKLDQDPMQMLEKLPNLRILVLEIEAYVGKNMHCSAPSFPELRCLKLSKLYNLEAWEVDEEALPKLSTLEISNCRRMKMLPNGLQGINTIRKLKISMMPEQFVGRIRQVDGKGGEDLHKINSKCTMEFRSEDPWLEPTVSESQMSDTTRKTDSKSN